MRPPAPLPAIDMQDVVAIAREAGDAIMQRLAAGVNPEPKPDGSKVTDADKIADAIVRDRLKKLTPNIPILSEEGTVAEQAAANASRIKWVTDPLDGTNTSIRYAEGSKKHDQFGVHIALVVDGVPVRGVAHFPAMAEGKGVTYFTGNDNKAYKQTGNEPAKSIHANRPPLKHGELTAAVHFHESRRPEEIAGRSYTSLPGVGGQRVCMVAEGAADVADMNDIPLTHQATRAYKQWDLAAAHAILKAAGGELVSATKGQPITYDSEDFTVQGAYAGGRDMLNMLNMAQLAPASSRNR